MVFKINSSHTHPETFFGIIGKPGMVCYNTRDENLAFKIGRDKEIIVKHYGKKVVVFGNRRMHNGKAGCRLLKKGERK